MKTINQLVITAGILLSSLTVWADNAAEKASLETYFSWRGTNYEDVIALADANQGLRDSVNTLYQNSFAVIDTVGGKYIFQGFITLDGVAPDLGKKDSLYISADAAAYLGNNEYTEYLQSEFTQRISQVKDETGKCTGGELIVFGELPCRVEGINYAISGGMTYVVQKLMKSGNVDVANCILNSDVYFKAVANLMDLFGNSTIYKAAKKKPLIYEVPLAKAKRLKFLNLETYTREVTSGNYGTICLDKQFIAMEGVEGLYVPSYKDASKLYCAKVKLSDVVAGGAYIFKADSAVIVLTLEGEAVAAAVDNDHMIGWLAADSVLSVNFVNDHAGYALLASNQIVSPLTGSTIKKNRAFIDLANVSTNPPSAAGRYIALGINEATGLENAEFKIQNAECKMLVNGQLIIIRDGVKYNAMGQKME